MKRKTLRLYLLVVSIGLLSLAVGLALYAFKNKIVFFFSPSDIASHHPTSGQRVRLGGLVEAGSLQHLAGGTTVSFRVTDLKNGIDIRYQGILPDLFREGQGVVVEGSFDESGQFVATEVLAKHDEKYMPPEVAKALKDSGRWQETGGAAQPTGTAP